MFDCTNCNHVLIRGFRDWWSVLTCLTALITTMFLSVVSEIGADATTIVFLILASILSVASIVIFVEELVFLQRLHFGNDDKVKKLATILGLFPVRIHCQPIFF